MKRRLKLSVIKSARFEQGILRALDQGCKIRCLLVKSERDRFMLIFSDDSHDPETLLAFLRQRHGEGVLDDSIQSIAMPDLQRGNDGNFEFTDQEMVSQEFEQVIVQAFRLLLTRLQQNADQVKAS